MVTFILVLCSVFFAMNMGVSGFSVSFAPSYGSHLLGKNKAVFYYMLFVFIGGILIGPRVVDTLARRLSGQSITPLGGVLILAAAGITLFLSNLLKIPQSTSFVTVASFVGSGLYYDRIHWQTVFRIVSLAAIFSMLSFIVTFWITRRVYPPRQKNLRFYEFFHAHRDWFKRFIIWTDMYSAFGIGTNNVANVVAPLVGSLKLHIPAALGLGAIFFGLGARFFGEKVLKTVSRDIVPIGEISAAIVSFMTASLVIFASLLGLPSPYVQFTTFAVLAISSAKDGLRQTAQKAIFKKIVFVWLLVPLVTVLLSYLLHSLFL